MPLLPVGDRTPPDGVLYLNCPRCGLSIKPKARWLTIDHCPRCIARTSSAIKMLRTTSPADPRPAGPWFSGPERAMSEAQAG